MTGSGNWDTSTANWDPTPHGADVPWAQGGTTTATDGSVFGGPDGTNGQYAINIDNGQLAYTNITINNSGYTFSGSALYQSDANAATVIIAAGKTVTFSNQMTGANNDLSFEAGNGAVVNLMGGGGGAQAYFESTNSAATYYLNGAFTYSVTWIEALVFQTNGSYVTGGFNLGRPANAGLGSVASNATWIVTGPSTTFTMNNANLLDGRAGGQGTFIVSNGATVATLESSSSGQNDAVVLCNDSSGHESGVLDVYGGTVNVGASSSSTGGMIQMIPSGATATEYAIYNQTGGTVNAWGGVFFGDTSSATFSAGSYANFTNSGGFLYIGAAGPNGGGINKGVSFPSTNNIVLSGGTVGALGNWSSPMPITLGTLNGNITFQCSNASGNPYNISLTGPLTGSGGFNLTGTGTLTLSGTNNIAGSTMISNGTLVVSTTAGGTTNGGPVVVDGSNGSPTVAVVSSAGQFWSTGSLTFQNGAVALSNYFGALEPGTTVAPIQVAGNLAFAATPAVYIYGSDIPNGTYPLITYTGTLSGAPPTSATVTGPTGAPVGTITQSGKTLNLVVTGSTVSSSFVWNEGNDPWNKTSAYWLQNGVAAVYADGDAVFFNDNAPGASPITVALNIPVNPGSVTFDNSAKNYIVSGPGAIDNGNNAFLALQGSGTVTLANTNTYAGGTTVNSGQLNINNGGDNSGSDSAIGTGTLTIGSLTSSAAVAIDNTSGSNVTLVPSITENWNGSFTYVGSANAFNTGSGSVTMAESLAVTVNANNFVVGGSIGDNNNNYVLSKAGSGVLTLLNNNSFGGGFHLLAGQLNLGNPNSTGTGALSIESGTALDNVSGGFLTLAASAYTWSGPFSYLGSTTNTLDLGSATVTSANNTAPIFVNVVSNTFETDADVITGNNIVTKIGQGTWIMGGSADNNNNLILAAAAGEVVLAKSSGFAIGNRGGGGLTVESNALVLDEGDGNPNVGNGQGVAVVFESGGVFDLNGNTETFDSLAMSGGAILQNGDSGSGATLNVTGDNTGLFVLGDTNCIFNVVSNATITINASISGSGSLVKSNLGELYLTEGNSYSGETLIQSGTVGLQGSGSIESSSLIYLAGSNSALDLSQSSQTDGNGNPILILTNGQTLGGFGTVTGLVTTVSGSTLSPGSASAVGTLTLTGASGDTNTLGGTTIMAINAGPLTNSQLVVQQGGLVYGGALVVNNLAGTLAAGHSFTLFSAPGGLSGSFSSITLPTLSASLAWTNNLGSGGSTIGIVSVGPPPSPRINAVSKSDGNLVFSGTNGPADGTYYVLTSTNLALALTNWTVLSTNAFSASGGFSVTNPISGSSSYFILEIP